MIVQTPRLVATDVDGTLVGPDGPSARTRTVLERVRAAGVPVVIATGRPPRWTSWVCDALDVHELVVAANGAVLWDAATDRVLEAITLGVAELGAVLAGAREAVPGCGLAVERALVGAGVADPGVVPFLCEPAYDHAWPKPDHVEVPPEELAREPVIKVLVRHRTLTSDVMAEAVRRVLGDLVDVTYSSGGGLVECSVRGVTKATGLARAAGRLAVSRDDVVAFGDMPNDLEMLRWAGLGVAMANGDPGVRAAADEVTSSNLDDGVASVLERWF